jgi:ribosome maturation factor RimP
VNLEKIREAAERVARSEGLEVVDVEWKVGKQRFLRVYIDKVPGGPGPVGANVPKPAAPMSDAAGQIAVAGEGVAVTGGGYAAINHADCEQVSRQLSVILDVEELISGSGYILEISSPGLDRELRKPADFERFKGRLAKISTTEPVGDAKFFEGRLAGFVDGRVRMELKGRGARIVELPLAGIRKANLVVEF